MKKLINRIANKIQQYTNEEKELNDKWKNIQYILNSNNFNNEYLDLNYSIQEIEHQVGRYLNMKIIIDDVANNKVHGDIVEFGTWQG